MDVRIKDNVIKQLKQLTPTEVAEAVAYNKNLQKIANEEIIKKRLIINTLNSKSAKMQRKVQRLTAEINEEISILNRNEKILIMLEKRHAEQKFSKVWKKFENDQIEVPHVQTIIQTRGN